MVKLPLGSAKALGRPQTGTPGAWPSALTGFPARSKSCQASDPPFDQAVPSVQASRTFPFAEVTTAGCFRLLLSPGAEMEDEDLRDAGSILSKYTWPAVSHAAKTWLPRSAR